MFSCYSGQTGAAAALVRLRGADPGKGGAHASHAAPPHKHVLLLVGLEASHRTPLRHGALFSLRWFLSGTNALDDLVSQFRVLL